MAEKRVVANDPMPMGYVFVPKGDIYLTRNCRKTADTNGCQIFVVRLDKTETAGIRVPAWIYNKVMHARQETEQSRAEAVQKRDEAHKNKVWRKVVQLFPMMPERDIDLLLNRALKKRSGRVGRSTKLPVDDMIIFATRAHIRHNHTEYENFLKSGMKQVASRKAVAKQIERTLWIWAGGKDTKTVQRKTKKCSKAQRKAPNRKKKKRKARPTTATTCIPKRGLLC